MCAAARVGNQALVYQIAEQALAEGFWYGEVMWRQTPSFQPLQGDPDFEHIVAASRAAEAQDTPAAAPPLIMRLPEDHSSASPLLVALHGNQRTATATLPFWQAASAQGWVLALPQSTQAMYKSAYAWDDLAASFAAVQADFAKLKELTTFDASRVALAGHSMGGLVAIQMALAGALNVRGFVANGPAAPFLDAPEELKALLAPARERGLRGYFILGAQDTDINADEIHALAAQLQSAGIACEIETVPQATHDYAPVYDAALLRALAFVDAA
jgi:dienelactone hydrolase